MSEEKYRCEKCDLFECTCFCRCGLAHDICVCNFTEKDFMTPIQKITAIEKSVNFLYSLLCEEV